MAGGLLDPDEEADVPGGAPVIIEDFFKGCLGGSAPEGSSSHRTSDDTGIWCATRLNAQHKPAGVHERLPLPCHAILKLSVLFTVAS